MSSQAEGQPSLEDAVRAYQRGEAQRAESLCRQCLENEPGNDQASLLLSVCIPDIARTIARVTGVFEATK